jgi:hypothetical protein
LTTTASTTLALADNLISLLQPCQIFLITTADGGVNPLMEMVKVNNGSPVLVCHQEFNGKKFKK